MPVESVTFRCMVDSMALGMSYGSGFDSDGTVNAGGQGHVIVWPELCLPCH